MRRSRVLMSAVVLGWLGLSPAIASAQAGGAITPVTYSSQRQPNQATVLDTYGKLPFNFEVNQGQSDAKVRFLTRSRDYTLFLTSAEAVLVLHAPSQKPSTPGHQPSAKLATVDRTDKSAWTEVRMKLVGANPQPEIVGLEGLHGKVNYFLGSDRAKWRTNIPTYAKVKYHAVYPGVDMVYSGSQRQTEFDFVVAPGATPQAITLAFQGVDTLEVQAPGDLFLQTGGGPLRLRKPHVYQEKDGVRQEIAGSYVLKGPQQVGFQVGAYDTNRPLVIDPILVYSTYLGGSGDDVGHGIAVDAAGHAYVTGETASPEFPQTPPQGGTLHGTYDVFVTKLASDGSALVYSTFLGGTRDDSGNSIAVDPAGNAFVTGTTDSPDFPLANPSQVTFSGNRDAFVAKLTPTGAFLTYATYLGGENIDEGRAIAVDAEGHAYVTGTTASSNFPTINSMQATPGGVMDAFVTKFNPSGSAVVYSTFLGGSNQDFGLGIAVDAVGAAYVTGATHSPDFAIADPLQFKCSCDQSAADAFVAKVNPAGTALAYATYLGGSGDDAAYGIAVDTAGSAYVTGTTGSADLPLKNPVQSTFGGGPSDVFVANLTSNGTALAYATYLGGSGDDAAYGIAVDTAGSAYITGGTNSTNFPTANPLSQVALGGNDVFMAKLADIEASTAGLDLTPTDPFKVTQELFQSAEADWGKKHWQEALKKYAQVANSSSSFASKAHIKTGMYYKYLGRWSKAITEYEAAIAKAHVVRDIEDAQTSIAAVYISKGDHEKASSLCKEVISKTTDWQQVKYCTYWVKELKRRIALQKEGLGGCNTCGPNALIQLLKLRGVALSDEERNRITTLDPGGASLEELARKAEPYGVQLHGVKLSLEQLREIKKPLIALIDDPNHYVVVTGVDAAGIRLIDPARGSIESMIPQEEFAEVWKGHALVSAEGGPQLAMARLSADDMKALKGRICYCCPDSTNGTQTCNTAYEATSSIGGGAAGLGMPVVLINTVSLNLIIQDTDLAYGSRGPRVHITRTYNADDFREGPFGRSWTFNYNMTLTANPDGSVDIRRETGTIHHFTSAGAGNYTPPSTIYDTLTRNADDTYSLKLKRNRRIQRFDSNGRLFSITDRNGNAVTLQYDAGGRLVSITDAVGRVTTLTYVANGKISAISDPLGRTATYTYDANNNLVSTTDMAGTTVRYTYNNPTCPAENEEEGTCSYITSITTPKGTTTITYTTSYEGFGLTSMTDPIGNVKSYGTTPESDYKVQIVDANGSPVLYTNTSLDRGATQSITDALGNPVSFVYDLQGNRIGITNAKGNHTALTYDTRGNITSVIDPLTNRVTLTYDTSRDNLQDLTDPLSRTSQYEYDSRDNLTKVTDPANGITTFTYDAFGQLTSLTDPKGNSTTFTYDAQGNLASMTTPGGRTRWYTHDAVGRLISMTTPKGDTITYQYDGIDRITRITYPDGNVITYTYDCCNLTGVSDRNGTVSFVYDVTNRMTSFTDVYGKTVQYAYDKAGNLTSLTYPNGKVVTYEYDQADRLTKVTDWLGNAITYQYDAAGNLVSSVTPGGLATSYQLDKADRLTSLGNVKSDASILSSHKYTLDAAGNRRTISALEPLSPILQPASITSSSDADNRLTAANGTVFSYDNNGNLISETEGANVKTYSYDLNDRLMQAVVNGQTTQYQYDALGNRIARTVGGVTTRYIVTPGGLPSVLAETDSSGNITSYYVYGLGLVSKITPGGQVYFYQYDGLGSTIAMTDLSGNVVNQYAYDPFGNLANSTETVPNPFRYVGRFGVMDEGNGLLYMRARYYSPANGRFINQDPIGLLGGLNMYAYAGNNPVNLIDPIGKGFQSIFRSFLEYVGFLEPIAGPLTNAIASAGATAAQGQPVDVTSTILSSTISIPGMATGGEAVAYALDPNNSLDLACGILTTVKEGGKGPNYRRAERLLNGDE